jgi:hypothetical protein
MKQLTNFIAKLFMKYACSLLTLPVLWDKIHLLTEKNKVSLG